MAIFRVGPDGLLLFLGLIVSVLVAALAWRRATLSAAAIATAAVAMAGGIWLGQLPNSSHPVVAGLFMIVPSLLLFGASRIRWISRNSWLLVLVGPLIFIGCYVGICEFCVKTGLI